MPEVLQPILSLFPYLLFLFLIALAFRILKYYLESKKVDSYLPYIKIESIMTTAEQKYFRQLEQQYEQTHYVFPQVKLDKIVTTTDQKNFYSYWNKINKKSIDFVLVDKQTLQTVQLIELNDYTHNQPKRKQRDEFLQKVCTKTGVELKTIN